MTAPPREALGAGEAAITPSFERGALLLGDTQGRVFRLSWEEADAGEQDRRRALPAGHYRLVGYRLIQRDEAGSTWHLSATAPAIRELELASGEERALEIDPAIRIEKRVSGDQLQVAIQGEGHAGLSIYRQEKRIPIEYRLLDAGGRELAAGKIRYG